jgi:hypothetical protein
METRLTRQPGQNGTKRLVERFGERLVCVRYRYDAEHGRRYKTVELIVESVPWRPRPRRVRRREDDIVAVRIAWNEAELRERESAWARCGARRRRSGRCNGATRSD